MAFFGWIISLKKKNGCLAAKKKIDGTYNLEKFPFSSKMVNFKDPYGNEVFFAQKEQIWFGGMLGMLEVDLKKLNQSDEKLAFANYRG